MVDSGATTTFLSRRFVKENRVVTRKLATPIPLYNIDGTLNRDGTITDVAILELEIGAHREKVVFTVTDIGMEDIIIGLDWLRKHNPEVDWDQGTLKLSRCPASCRPCFEGQLPAQTDTRDTGVRPTARQRTRRVRKVKEVGKIRATVMVEEDLEPATPSSIPVEWDNSEDALLYSWEQGHALSNAPQLFAMAGYTYSQQLAEQEYQKKEVRPVEQIVPERYHQYLRVFSKDASERLPEHGPYDHAIELVPEAKMFHSRVYPLSPNEQVELDKFLQENLAKGYISESKSPISSPFFFIKKKDGSLRPVQDYRRLNEITVKNRYPIPLVSELVDRLKQAKVFTKLDIRWGYNNIRIKTGDEWKAAFVTNRGLFEPNVMFFGLTNSPSTFSAFMNDIFKDLIVEGKITIYLDDILIFSNDLETHRAVTREVLKRLAEHDLFCKPEKCEFEVPKVEYLGVLVSHNRVEMDPVKVKGIQEWPTPRNASDVRKFRGFANFYRRFIQDFSRICKPLDRLTGKVPWQWGQDEQEAFDELKRRFVQNPVLCMYDPNKDTRIEVDASGYATGGVLAQLQDDGKWHPVAFHSESMSEAERNYEIYDKEMLAIIRALEAWRHYLEGLPRRFEIQSDHKNLEYWRTAQHLTRRQARWALYLSRFDFEITHKPGTSNGRADALSRRPDHQKDDADDNLDQIVLRPEQFRLLAARRGHNAVVADKALLKRIRTCSEREQEVAEALQKVEKLGPARLQSDLVDWNVEQGLILYRGKVYVPKDEALRTEIVRIHHDLPPAGHPGQWKTLELVSRNYWWPGMGKFVKEYVGTCDTCRRTKPVRSRPQGLLKPNEIPERPGQIVTCDYIVGLPEIDGHNAIQLMADRHGKLVHLVPCSDEIDAGGAADVFIREYFRLHGLPRKIISDRGPQFAADLFRAILKGLGIESALSTAYHPQTDGQSERFNQEGEAYLRAFCSQRRDDWVKWLPIAEYALNARVHSSTGYSPFFLMYGYEPQFLVPANPDTPVPAANERLAELAKAREDATAALTLAAERMKEYFDRHAQDTPTFTPGQKVWLDTRNLRFSDIPKKLADKFAGPYPVVRRVGELAYELKLPHTMKIHPVFHVSLLHAHKQSTLPGRVPPEPAPIEVEGEEEYEVEEIRNSRRWGRWHKLQYLVRWKGWGPENDSWEDAADVEHAAELVEAFHNRHPDADGPHKPYTPKKRRS